MKPAIERLQESVLPIAAADAAAVDREARFPDKTFAALKAERLLSVLIPVEFGGEGLSLQEVADLCSALGQVCASSGLIFAMHHIKTSSLVYHAAGSPWHEEYMRRAARDQLLLGSATTEGGLGGDLRNSLCPVEYFEENGVRMFRVEKEATVISYGDQADAILITARKDADSPTSDQVFVIGERHQNTLVKTGGWNTFGMRGTCSDGFRLKIVAPAEQVFPLPFAEIAAQSMLAHTHILWSSVWYGIAAEAAARAQALVRSETRRRAAAGLGSGSPAMARLAELLTELQAMRNAISGSIARFEQGRRDPEKMATVGFLLDMNSLKVLTSRKVVEILDRAMEICGIHGYRNDTPYTLERLMRDAHSAPIMINNDRILNNMANLALMNRFGSQLS